MLNCPENYVNYLITTDDLEGLEPYFYSTPVGSWNLEQYQQWHKQYYSKSKTTSPTNSYKNNLTKISKSDNIAVDIKSYVGNLLKMKHSNKNDKNININNTYYNPGTVINGDDAIVSIHNPSNKSDGIEQHDQQQQETASTSSSTRTNILPPFQFRPKDLPYYERRYFVDGCDISKDFHNFQVRVSTLLNTGSKLTLESHVHHILSMSHIFLVSPKRMHSDIKDIMGSNTIDLLSKNLSATYFMKEHKFTIDLFTEIIMIIKDVIDKIIDRTTAASKLLALKPKSEHMEFLIITSIMMMILYLPDDTLNDDPKEMELINGYLHPCLSPLFHDPSNGVLFRWCDTINLEATKTTISISKRRPDNCITQLYGYEYDCNLGFGEVKSHHETRNPAAICKDLIRLGIFSKNSIDLGNMNAVICFQAIGRHVTFYVTKLMADGLYIMYELTSLKVPGSIDELLSYVGHLDKILDLLYVFHDQCYIMNPEQQQETANKKRKTLSTPDYATIIESTINNKRHCIIKPNIQ